jgi:DNA-binding winged helix-turn-helix (wHTH) protein/tetratricopeptide (TPR) repeat protein
MATAPKFVYEFGPFRIDPDKQLLLRENQPVAITPKAFEILLILARRSREVVSKDELMNAVWPDAFVEEANLSQNIFMLRKALGDTPEDRHYIVTLPGRGYRFAADVHTVTQDAQDLLIESHLRAQIVVEQAASAPAETVKAPPTGLQGKGSWKYLLLMGAVVILVVFAAVLYFRRRQPVALGDQDTIMIADFTNTTSDPVFDETLKQALRVQIEQSPFLNVLSDQEVEQELAFMGRRVEQPLTADIARDLCQRVGSKAFLTGSIASLGSHYAIGLGAFNCQTGKGLGSEQVEADDREHVLRALGTAAKKIRKRLGESLASIQKYDAPIEQATTPSLEALKVYSLGRKASAASEWAAAVPFFQRAVRLDPNFAMAFARLGNSYKNLGETTLGLQNISKAYELRERVSEPEKLYIEAHYYQYVTGNLENAMAVYQLWAQTYPRDFRPFPSLFAIYTFLGRYDQALAAAREALRLHPTSGMNYNNVVESYRGLNRLEEARATAAEAQARGFDSSSLRFNLYNFAFLQNDATGRAQQVAWATGKPGVEDVLLANEADTKAYAGRLMEARELSRQAVASALRAGEKEVAATNEADAAVREVLFGNIVQARQRAAAALALSTGRQVQYEAALALALVGDAGRAQTIAEDLAKRFPEHTIVQFKWLPTVHAQLALSRNDYSKAITLLQTAAPYELGVGGNLHVVYVRGEAYLAAHQGTEAAGEFQKILDHRGIVLNQPIGALARMQIARAYMLQGDTAKARAAYQDFLTPWKDADPDIPILKQAKAEYAKLQ